MSRAGDFSGRAFRANPLYELVPFERLGEAERQALAGLEEDPAAYGILRPRPRDSGTAGLGIKSADRDTALLFLTLREPGPLPSYVRRAFGEAGLQAVTRLVADGVLEIASDAGFLSGAAALQRLGGSREPVPHGRLAALSLSALRHGCSLLQEDPGLDPMTLAVRLYGYNTWPLTPRWHRLLVSSEAARAWLGIAPGGPHHRRLAASWSAHEPAAGWLHWTLRSPLADAPRSGPTYKLYISPAPGALADGFGAILEALTAARPFQFKMGAGAPGLLRPDKIVAYFPGFDRLAEAAATLADRLAALPVHGVPFTAEIAGDGLLSWGIDPPASERSAWGGRESWRFWLVQRLARALLSAQDTSEPWRFAVERLRLEGIDTDTWTPGALLWKQD